MIPKDVTRKTCPAHMFADCTLGVHRASTYREPIAGIVHQISEESRLSQQSTLAAPVQRCERLGKILYEQILTNPIMLAFIFGTGLNVSDIEMPKLLEHWCGALNTSFSCMIFFLIGLCIELKLPSRSEIQPTLAAIGLRITMQATMIGVFLLLLKIMDAALNFQMDSELRVAFSMCMMSPCTNMVLFWTLQFGHPLELSALFISTSNIVSLIIQTILTQILVN